MQLGVKSVDILLTQVCSNVLLLGSFHLIQFGNYLVELLVVQGLSLHSRYDVKLIVLLLEALRVCLGTYRKGSAHL